MRAPMTFKSRIFAVLFFKSIKLQMLRVLDLKKTSQYSRIFALAKTRLLADERHNQWQQSARSQRSANNADAIEDCA